LTSLAASLAIAAVIAIAACWAYAPSLDGVFVLDDVRAIVNNSTIRSMGPLATVLTPPDRSTVAGRPVANLSLAINAAVARAVGADPFGADRPGPSGPEAGVVDPTPFHVGNLLIHVCAALVLWGVVARTLRSPRLREWWGGVATWIGPAVALIWVVHPLTTSAVTYVVQRAESLMGLWYLLTLYCAIRALDGAPPPAPEIAGARINGARPQLSGNGARPHFGWMVGAVLACLLGMATKEAMVTAPVMVAVWAFVCTPAGDRAAARARWPLWLGLGSTWIVLGWLVAGEGRAPSIALTGTSVWSYLLTQTDVIVHYVRLSFVPSPLVFFYDWPLVTSFTAVWWQAALLVVLAGATVAAIWRRHPASLVGAWFFLVLAPSSSVLPIVTEVAAEHRMYLPLAAVIAVVVLAAVAAGQRFIQAGRVAAVAGLCAVLALVIPLGVETRARNNVYASAESLWRDTVTKRPNDARARVAYGDVLANAGRLPDAEVQLTAAVAIAPDDPVANVRLGVVFARQGRHPAAIARFEHALVVRPGDVDAHRFLGQIYWIARQDALAVHHDEQALAAMSDDVQVLTRLASVLADSRDVAVRNPSRAIVLAERAASLTARRDARVLEVLAVAQAASGRFADAASSARAAARLAESRGDRAAVSALEYRASAYDAAARR
jgi:Flp pilus assembly protein TadD